MNAPRPPTEPSNAASNGSHEPDTRPSIPLALASLLKRAIPAAGYQSNREFAAAIKMNPATISGLLAGKLDARLSTIEQLAKGLGIVPYELLQRAIEAQIQATEPPLDHPTTRESEVLLTLKIPIDRSPPSWLVSALDGAPDTRKPTPTQSKTKKSPIEVKIHR